MSKIRVLIVDDSVVIRKLLSEQLSIDPAIEVVGTASDGKIGLAKIPQTNPELVILDIEMPVMDGLQTLAAIRKTYPSLPVIMFSTLTERGAAATLDALSLGANDYATKSTEAGLPRDQICAELISKVKAVCLRTPPVPKVDPSTFKPSDPGHPLARTESTGSIDIVAIGVSTGGPNALAALLPHLPRNFPVPVVIVQHMPKMFTRMLAERLTALSGHNVREARTGEQLVPGDFWIAPGGFHLEVERGSEGVHLKTHEGLPENSCRPAVDVLFRSVAQVYRERTLGVILTGMGQDGLRGCENIRSAGGRILAQDEASSVVWGMPGAVSRAGLAEKVLPLAALAAEMHRIARIGFRSPEVAKSKHLAASPSLARVL